MTPDLKTQITQHWSQPCYNEIGVSSAGIERAIRYVDHYFRGLKLKDEEQFKVGVKRYIECELLRGLDGSVQAWDKWKEDMIKFSKNRRQMRFNFGD